MPYIGMEKREQFQAPTNEINKAIKLPGDLNYVITLLCHLYIKTRCKNYATLNEVDGVLDCVKKEFYRKIIAPYEDNKEAETGPITDLGEW